MGPKNNTIQYRLSGADIKSYRHKQQMRNGDIAAAEAPLPCSCVIIFLLISGSASSYALSLPTGACNESARPADLASPGSD